MEENQTKKGMADISINQDDGTGVDEVSISSSQSLDTKGNIVPVSWATPLYSVEGKRRPSGARFRPSITGPPEPQPTVSFLDNLFTSTSTGTFNLPNEQPTVDEQPTTARPTLLNVSPSLTQSVMETMVNGSFPLDDDPQLVVCPKCHETVVTDTRFQKGILSWIACVGISCMGCNFGCCMVPFWKKEFQDVAHTCPNCGEKIGIYNRLDFYLRG